MESNASRRFRTLGHPIGDDRSIRHVQTDAMHIIEAIENTLMVFRNIDSGLVPVPRPRASLRALP